MFNLKFNENKDKSYYIYIISNKDAVNSLSTNVFFFYYYKL